MNFQVVVSSTFFYARHCGLLKINRNKKIVLGLILYTQKCYNGYLGRVELDGDMDKDSNFTFWTLLFELFVTFFWQWLFFVTQLKSSVCARHPSVLWEDSSEWSRKSPLSSRSLHPNWGVIQNKKPIQMCYYNRISDDMAHGKNNF